jgi:MFS family permease
MAITPQLTATTKTGQVKSRQLGILVTSSFIGTTLEAFDFNVYAFLTPLVFNKLFFPQLTPAIATIASFSVFAVGFLSRPLGGVVFGHFGDRTGRKPMMVVTLLLMGVSTAAIGLIPSYASIGIWAPITLTALRFLQGIAYGGESSVSPLLVSESTPDKRRGFYTALTYSGILGGVLLSAVTVDLVGRLGSEEMLSWGWRVPFLLSIVGVAVGMYFRLKVEESPTFMAKIAKNRPLPVPIIDVLRSYKMPTLITALISMTLACMYYFFAVFGLSYAVQTAHVQPAKLFEGIIIGNIVALIFMPLCGLLSDVIGRRPVIAACFVTCALFAVFGFFPLLRLGDGPYLFLATAVPAVLAPLAFGPSAALFAELYDDARVRFSGGALGRQVGTLLGGLLPVVSASIMAATTSGLTYVIILFVGICAVTTGATYMTRETKNIPL